MSDVVHVIAPCKSVGDWSELLNWVAIKGCFAVSVYELRSRITLQYRVTAIIVEGKA